MAITQTAIRNSNGINFTYVTDSSLDWSGVTNSTYFKNLSDGLIYFKNSSGTVLSMYNIFTGGTIDGLTATTISASTYSNLPSPSITVGTSQLTSGTDTRVLFQSGTTLQQDSNFSYNTTQKRLILQANGTAGTNIPLQILNSAGSANLVEIAGNNTFTFLSTPGKAVLSNVSNGGPLLTFGRDYTNQEVVRISGNDYPSISLTKLNTTSSISIGTVANGISMNYNAATGDDSFQIQNSFHNVFQVIGNPNSASASFRLGSISSNANFFNLYGPNGGGTGINATQLFNVNTNGNVGIGMVTTGARLDVRSPGTTSANIAFRVRNSTDTATSFSILGSNQFIFGTSTTTPEGNILVRHDFGSAQPAFTIRNGEFGNLIFQVRDERTASTTTVGNFRMNGMIIGGESGLTRRFDLGGYGLGSYGDSSANMVWENNQGNIGDGQGSSVISVSSNFYVNLQTTKKYKFEAVTGNFGIGNVGSLGARLDVRAQGALSTDIAFRVRNSVDTQNLMSVAGNGDVAIGLNASGVTVASYPFIAIGSGAKASQYGLSIGVGSGANQDNNDRRNIYIGTQIGYIGTNQTATCNVGIGVNNLYAITTGDSNVAISAGNSSNDSAGQSLTTGSGNVFVGRGSSAQVTTGIVNTTIGRYSGEGNVSGSANTQIGFAVGQAAGVNKSYITAIGMRLNSSHNGAIMIGSSGDLNTNATSISDDAAQFHFRSTAQSFFFNKNTNVVLRSNSSLTSGTHFEAAATNTFTIHSGTAPVTNISDAFQQYSADITAGNAAPHFRTENGSIIKLYQNANTVAIDDNLINLGVRASGGTSTFTNPISVGLFSATTGTINGNLTITGDTTMPNRSAFSVYGAGTTNNLTTTQNGDGTLNTNNFGLTYSQGTGFDISTGIFTAPIAGLYQVTLIGRNSGFAGGISQLAVLKNNSNASGNVMMIEWGASSSMNHTGGAQIFKLGVGDTLRLKVLAGQINFDGNDNWSVAYIG